MSKVYLELLRRRLEQHVETHNLLPNEQNAFRRNRGCEDNIFIIRSLLNHKKMKKENVYVAFMDISKAYDRVFRDGLWSKRLKLGITGKIWRLLRDIYGDSKSALKTSQGIWSLFPTEEGLRKGCLLSPLLFALFFADVVLAIKDTELGARFYDLILCILKFADDIALTAESRAHLQLIYAFENYCYDNRLDISQTKSAVMYFE